MSWSHIVADWGGVKVQLVGAEGRQIIRMGTGQHKEAEGRGKEMREVIVEMLQEYGQLSTSELYDELSVEGFHVTYESLYSVLKKMNKKAVLTKQIIDSMHGGKGIALWRL